MLSEAIKLVAEETQEDRQAYRHRPSAACKCIRALVYHANGVEPKPLPGRALLVFDDSKWHEELTANWIRKTAYRLHSEQMKVDICEINGTTMSGSIDGIIQDLAGREYLWEHKAINHFAFQRIENDAAAGHEYYVQCALYLCGLHTLQPDINSGILCVKNKNTAQYLEYLVEANWPDIEVYSIAGTQKVDLVYGVANVIQTCKEVFAAVDWHVIEHTLPSRPYQRDDWHCSYCGWQEPCWSSYRQEIQDMPENQDLSKVFESNQLFEECLTLQATKALVERQLASCKTAIKQILDAKQVRGGRYGDIVVNRSFREVKSYVVPARADEVITVRHLKKEEE